jgi:Ca2+-binding RTX toxin-like protein
MTAMRTDERSKTRKRLALGAATVVLVLVSAASAVAAQLLIRGSASKPDLEYLAVKGERNDVHVFDTKAGYTIQDLSATIKNSTSSCKRSADRHKLTCPHHIRRGGPRRKPAFLKIVLGDRSDAVTTSSLLTLPVMIFGDTGDDRLLGGAGNDSIYGKDGDDYIDGRGGHDTLSGGAGDDIIISNDDVQDIVKCGPGFDRVDADHFDKVSGDCERVEA